MSNLFNISQSEMRIRLGKLLEKTNLILSLELEINELLEKSTKLLKEYIAVQHYHIFILAKKPENIESNEMLYLAGKFNNIFLIRLSKKIDISKIPSKYEILYKEISRAIQGKVDIYEELQINKKSLKSSIDKYIKVETLNANLLNCNDILELFLKNESLAEKSLYNIISIIDPLKDILDKYFKEYIGKEKIYIEDLIEELDIIQKKYNLSKKETFNIIEFVLGKTIGKMQKTSLIEYIHQNKIIVTGNDSALNNNCIATIEDGQYIFLGSISTLPEIILLAHELGHATELKYIGDDMKRIFIEYLAYSEISSNLYQLIMYKELRIIKEVKFLFAITCMQMLLEFIIIIKINLELIKNISTDEKIKNIKFWVDKYSYPSKDNNNERFINYIDFNGLSEIKYSIGLIVGLNILEKTDNNMLEEAQIINYFKAKDNLSPEERLEKYLDIDITSQEVITIALNNIKTILFKTLS